MNEPSLHVLSLGKAIKEYPRSKKSFLKIGCLSLISATLAGFIFYGAFSESGNPIGQKIGLSLLGALIALPALAGIYMLVSRRGSCVRLYENGIYYRQGGKEFAANWDEIASVTQSTASRIAKRNGESFDIGDNVEEYDELAEKIRQETLQRMLPQAKEAIGRGESLDFPGLKVGGDSPVGKVLNETLLAKEGLKVNAQGVESGGQSIAWADLKEFGVRLGEGRRDIFPNVFLKSADLTFQVKYATMPNAHLLLALCKEFSDAKPVGLPSLG